MILLTTKKIDLIKWRGQLHQDRWIAEMTNFKEKGCFVDVGAFDGKYFSNTYVLEKNFGWNGLCIEPGRAYNELVINRSCLTDNSVVYDTTGKKVAFKISTVDEQLNGIEHDIGKFKNSEGYVVERETQSLLDTFKKYSIPKNIDYLSIDTEGSEYEILKTFDFITYHISYITIEHNYEEPKREKIKHLLKNNGFRLVQSVEFDDWYAHRNVLNFITFLRYHVFQNDYSLKGVESFKQRRDRHFRYIGKVGSVLKRTTPFVYKRIKPFFPHREA